MDLSFDTIGTPNRGNPVTDYDDSDVVVPIAQGPANARSFSDSITPTFAEYMRGLPKSERRELLQRGGMRQTAASLLNQGLVRQTGTGDFGAWTWVSDLVDTLAIGTFGMAIGQGLGSWFGIGPNMGLKATISASVKMGAVSFVTGFTAHRMGDPESAWYSPGSAIVPLLWGISFSTGLSAFANLDYIGTGPPNPYVEAGRSAWETIKQGAHDIHEYFNTPGQGWYAPEPFWDPRVTMPMTTVPVSEMGPLPGGSM